MMGTPSGAAVFLLARGCERCSNRAENTTPFEHFIAQLALVQCAEKEVNCRCRKNMASQEMLWGANCVIYERKAE